MRQMLALTCAAIGLSGCAWQVAMMPRDTGRVYVGQGHGDGLVGGSVTIAIDGRTYSGPVMRTSSNESFGLYQWPRPAL
jgi:hypothetical protein